MSFLSAVGLRAAVWATACGIALLGACGESEERRDQKPIAETADAARLAAIYGREAFVASHWRASTSSRCPMVADLVGRWLKDGESEAEVVSLLGIPSRREEGRLIWNLGPASSASIDEYYLSLLFVKGELAFYHVYQG